MLNLLGEHALHQAMASSVKLETDPPTRALLHEELLIVLAAGEIYAYLGQPLPLLRTILGGNELARSIDDVPQQAFTTSVAAFLLEFTPLRPLARLYLQQARRLVGRTVNPLAEAQVCRIGGIVYINNGQLERGTAMLDRAAELFRILGNEFMVLFSLTQAAIGRMLMGLTAAGESMFAEIGAIAQRGRHQHSYITQLAWLGLYRARYGQHREVRAQLVNTFEQSEHRSDPLVTVAITTAIITASLRTGNFADARRFAEESLALVPPSPTGLNYFVTLTAAIDAYLTLWEKNPAGLDAADSSALQKGLALLPPYASAILLARPQAQLLESRVAFLRGQKDLARRKADSALALAMQMRLPYEEALAHETLGRIVRAESLAVKGHQLPADRRAQSADEHLRRAIAMFKQLGDLFRAHAIESLLAEDKTSSH